MLVYLYYTEAKTRPLLCFLAHTSYRTFGSSIIIDFVYSFLFAQYSHSRTRGNLLGTSHSLTCSSYFKTDSNKKKIFFSLWFSKYFSLNSDQNIFRNQIFNKIYSTYQQRKIFKVKTFVLELSYEIYSLGSKAMCRILGDFQSSNSFAWNMHVSRNLFFFFKLIVYKLIIQNSNYLLLSVFCCASHSRRTLHKRFLDF